MSSEPPERARHGHGPDGAPSPLTNTPQKRLEWVDAARGIAALSVTVYHFQIGAGLARATHLPWFLWIGWPGSHVAVPLFFVISGFSIHYAEHAKIRDWPRTPGALKSYFSRRLWRIYPPYLAALVLALGIGKILGHPASGPDVASHLLMVHQFLPAYFNSINVVFWSIGVEMWLYLLYPFALRLLEKHGLVVAGVAVFLLSAVSIAATVAAWPQGDAVGLWFVPNVFFGWCMGAAVAEGFIQGNFFFLSARWWMLGAGLLALHLGWYFSGAFAGWLWPALVPSVIVLSAWPLAFLIGLERRRQTSGGGYNPLMGLLRWLGTISYSLYLVHQPLIDLRETALRHLPGHGVRQAVFCLWYAVPFAVAWLCWLGVERPSMKISKRLKAGLA